MASTRTVTTDRRCEHCARTLPAAAGTGRPRRYCGQTCRQRAYEERRVIRLQELAEIELRHRRAHSDALGDELAALVDLTRDLVARLEDDGLAQADPTVARLLGELRPYLSA